MSNAKNDLLPTRTAMFLCPFYTEFRAHDSPACVASVSVRFQSKKRGSRVKDRAKSSRFRSSFRAVKTENPFLGLSLLRNQTETLATQANDSQSDWRIFLFVMVMI